MTQSDRPDYLEANREYWNEQAPIYAEWAERAWLKNAPTWGIFGVPESDLGMFPDEMEGLAAVELGCGTGYISAWMKRRGAKPVAIDNSPKQLETARNLQKKLDIHFPLHLGNAEQTPFADASFDFAISEYGASIWCDPYKWIPEASRILKPGAPLVFLLNSELLALCLKELEADAATNELMRPQFGMHRFDWDDTTGVEFHIPHGDWIRLLRANDFDIEDLIHVQAPEGSNTSYTFVDYDWARQWPAEEVWKVRKRG